MNSDCDFASNVMLNSTKSSILRPPVRREPLQDLQMLQTVNSDEDTTTTMSLAAKRRVSFSGRNSVKEYVPCAEPIRVMNTPAYEEIYAHLSSDSSCLTNSYGQSDENMSHTLGAFNNGNVNRQQAAAKIGSQESNFSLPSNHPNRQSGRIEAENVDPNVVGNRTSTLDENNKEDSLNESDMCMTEPILYESIADKLRLSMADEQKSVTDVGGYQDEENHDFDKNKPGDMSLTRAFPFTSTETSNPEMSFTRAFGSQSIPDAVGSISQDSSNMSFTKAFAANDTYASAGNASMSFTKAIIVEPTRKKSSFDLSNNSAPRTSLSNRQNGNGSSEAPPAHRVPDKNRTQLSCKSMAIEESMNMNDSRMISTLTNTVGAYDEEMKKLLLEVDMEETLDSEKVKSYSLSDVSFLIRENLVRKTRSKRRSVRRNSSTPIDLSVNTTKLVQDIEEEVSIEDEFILDEGEDQEGEEEEVVVKEEDDDADMETERGGASIIDRENNVEYQLSAEIINSNSKADNFGNSETSQMDVSIQSDHQNNDETIDKLTENETNKREDNCHRGFRSRNGKNVTNDSYNMSMDITHDEYVAVVSSSQSTNTSQPASSSQSANTSQPASSSQSANNSQPASSSQSASTHNNGIALAIDETDMSCVGGNQEEIVEMTDKQHELLLKTRINCSNRDASNLKDGETFCLNLDSECDMTEGPKIASPNPDRLKLIEKLDGLQVATETKRLQDRNAEVEHQNSEVELEVSNNKEKHSDESASSRSTPSTVIRKHVHSSSTIQDCNDKADSLRSEHGSSLLGECKDQPGEHIMRASNSNKRKSDSLNLSREEGDAIESPSKLARIESYSNAPVSEDRGRVSQSDEIKSVVEMQSSPVPISDSNRRCSLGDVTTSGRDHDESQMDMSIFHMTTCTMSTSSLCQSTNSSRMSFESSKSQNCEPCYVLNKLTETKHCYSFYSDAFVIQLEKTLKNVLERAEIVIGEGCKNYDLLFANKLNDLFGDRLAVCRTVTDVLELISDINIYVFNQKTVYKDFVRLMTYTAMKLDNGRLIYDVISYNNRVWFTLFMDAQIIWESVSDESITFRPVIGNTKESDVKHLYRCFVNSPNRLKDFIKSVENFVKTPHEYEKNRIDWF